MNTFKGLFLLKKEKNETVCAIKELCDSYSGRQANNTKEEMFRKLCIIRLMNDEMEKVTLNKETIRSLDEIIDNLSTKFLDDRPLFLEIIKEYKEIVQKLDNPKLNPNPLYKRFDINEECDCSCSMILFVEIDDDCWLFKLLLLSLILLF
jgi:hypothetical protein